MNASQIISSIHLPLITFEVWGKTYETSVDDCPAGLHSELTSSDEGTRTAAYAKIRDLITKSLTCHQLAAIKNEDGYAPIKSADAFVVTRNVLVPLQAQTEATAITHMGAYEHLDLKTDSKQKLANEFKTLWDEVFNASRANPVPTHEEEDEEDDNLGSSSTPPLNKTSDAQHSSSSEESSGVIAGFMDWASSAMTNLFSSAANPAKADLKLLQTSSSSTTSTPSLYSRITLNRENHIEDDEEEGTDNVSSTGEIKQVAIQPSNSVDLLTAKVEKLANEHLQTHFKGVVEQSRAAELVVSLHLYINAKPNPEEFWWSRRHTFAYKMNEYIRVSALLTACDIVNAEKEKKKQDRDNTPNDPSLNINNIQKQLIASCRASLDAIKGDIKLSDLATNFINNNKKITK